MGFDLRAITRLLLFKVLLFLVIFMGPKSISQSQAFIPEEKASTPLYQSAAPERVYEFDGPEELKNIIMEAAAEYGLDPVLLEAIIAVESNFDANARSPQGAVGLMQLNPFFFELNQKELLSPYTNVMTGAAHIRELLDLFNWDLRLALAAYNAGVSQVRRYQGVPPFPDTKEYIKKVLKYMEVRKNVESQLLRGG